MKNKLALISIIIFTILIMFGVAKAQSSIDWERLCQSGLLNISTLDDGSVLVACLLADQVPTPTEVPPTATLVPPTEVPTPTIVPGIPGDPYPGAPECVMHDPNGWHGLWNSELGCHYDHTHGDNPHAVDDVFGTQAYEWMGGEISYPWQTFSAAGLENHLKHWGYIWVVRTQDEIDVCYSQYGDGCVMAFRSLVHFLSSDADAKVLYHSVWTEALVCDEANPTDCGIVRHGGWQYTGDLYVDDVLIKDELPPLYRAPQANKLHYTNSFATWYPVSAYGRTSVEVGDMWGLVDTSTPDINVTFFCYGQIGCEQNGSMFQPHVIGFGIGQRQIDSAGILRNQNTLFGAIDGKVNFVGYSDRYGRVLVDALGNPVTSCEIGLDCVPFQFDNITVGMQYQFRGGELANGDHPSGHNGRWPAGGYKEYDIYFNGESSNWIEYNVPLHDHH
jgi:hypothetical protein